LNNPSRVQVRNVIVATLRPKSGNRRLADVVAAGNTAFKVIPVGDGFIRRQQPDAAIPPHILNTRPYPRSCGLDILD